MVVANVPKDVDMNALSKDELAGIQRGKQFRESGVGYSIEHGTRPSTIGLVLASNPIALLAWYYSFNPSTLRPFNTESHPRVGEKYLEWSDENPSIDVILEAVSLYWFTDTFPSSIYSYRAVRQNPDPLQILVAKFPFLEIFRRDSWSRRRPQVFS